MTANTPLTFFSDNDTIKTQGNTMKKTLTLVALLSITTFAADYSAMTMTEMQALRGNVPTEDRAAFQSEMQTRVQAMTQEERQSMQTSMRQSKSGPQDGSGSKMRKGGSSGSGMQRRGAK
ncbi:MAG: DUF1104 domain-containing protein [Sulfuricurvum sp.]|nr:DUF1104 domain-containing protein [Sulfuricurvum sp.]